MELYSRAIMESMTDSLIVVNPDLTIKTVNRSTLDLLGYHAKEVEGNCIDMLFDNTNPAVEMGIDEVLRKGSVRDIEKTYIAKSGRKIPMSFSSSVVCDERGEIQGLLCIARNITERKETQDREKALRKELERSNAELEQFAYVASHDLREPLRMVTSYLQLLEKRNKTNLDKDSKEFIEFAVDGARRMDKLINSLLEYSRVGTRGQPFTMTDCENVLAKSLKNIEITIQERCAHITHDLLPKIMADEGQLVQLFQNLIGNAIKFCKDRKSEVYISAKRQELSPASPKVPAEQDSEFIWIFSVQDNGIGIAPEHQERIFQIFQRLHSREEYEGTGIGLAVCKKIVERHNGRIWVESEKGAGTIFKFAIPEMDQKDRPGDQ